MQDPVRFTLWIGGASLFLTLGCALYIVAVNAGSRNLALGLGALLGACVIFVVQLYFELQGSTTVEDFPIQFTTDYQTKSIRSRFDYAGIRNLITEDAASKVLASASPALTRDDAPRVTRDLGILSVVVYLLNEQFDWQLNAVVYKIGLGTMGRSEPLSSDRECTRVTQDQLRGRLVQAGNMFAGVEPLGMGGSLRQLCLPPASKIDVTENSVVLTTPVCRILIALQEPFLMSHSMDPTSPTATAGMPLLPDGSPRYVTVIMAGRATVEYFALRAQSPALSKYQAWERRVVGGLEMLFSTTQAGEARRTGLF